MAQKKLKRYHINWEGKSIRSAMIFLGLSFLLRAVYYFGCVRIETVGFWEILIWLIMPMLLESMFIVLLRVLKWDAPGTYALMAAAMGLFLILQNLGCGSMVRIILSVLTYVGCGVLIMGVAVGYLSKQICVTAYLMTALVRFFFFELGDFVFKLRVVSFIKESTGLFVLLAFVCLSNSFILKEKKK